jgi:lysophospholipase L1-like esterase
MGLAIAGLSAVTCLCTACSSSHSSSARTLSSPAPASSAATSPAPASPGSIVALGDSVPRGTNYDCRPYPPLTADDLATATERSFTATNDAVAGATSADVLAQLNTDDAVINHVRAADAIEIEVGANDVSYSQSCGTTVDCYTPLLAPLEKNLAAILTRTYELTSGHTPIVVLLDYWSVWLGGKYAAAKGQTYVNAAEEMTDRVNTIIKTTATDTGSLYVDLRAAFKGPDYSYDETHFLSSDGDHPNAAGHVQIAKAVETVVRPALH